MDIIEPVLRAFVAGLCLFAAYEDVRFLRIRNTLVLAVIAAFMPMLFILSWPQITAQGIAALVLLAIGAGLFFARLFGGGDAKLIAALALWVAPADIPAFLLIMTLAGGALSLAALALRGKPVLGTLAQKLGEKSWFAALARGEAVVPYGIAIAVAAALTVF